MGFFEGLGYVLVFAIVLGGSLVSSYLFIKFFTFTLAVVVIIVVLQMTTTFTVPHNATAPAYVIQIVAYALIVFAALVMDLKSAKSRKKQVGEEFD